MIKNHELTNHPFFDRQERISWWNQDLLFNSKILVVGAGALGNEVLKNLALLGIGQLIVVDFDVIEDSNLSRAVLFRSSDAIEGARKAYVAAERAKQLNPNQNAVVIPLHGDIVWGIGAGLFRKVDLIIGCLDNLEARMAVNQNCWKTRRTFIDGGMWELSGSVTIFDSSDKKACYECSMTSEHYRAAKIRYSCTNASVKSHIQHGYEPTTQITSAIIAAIQTQEAVKYLHGLPIFSGQRLVFNGDPHFYIDHDFSPISITELPYNPNCLCHGEDRYKDVMELPNAKVSSTTMRQLLNLIIGKTGEKEIVIELGHTFVISTICPKCDRVSNICRPLFNVFDQDIVCPFCENECPSCHHISIGKADCPNCGQTDICEPRLDTIDAFSINNEKVERFLDYTLVDLGVPPLQILRCTNRYELVTWVEISGDVVILGNLGS